MIKQMKTIYKTIYMLTLTTIFSQNTSAQTPVVKGIEHIGITVPDMKTALPFFKDILGFTPVTEIGPFELDDAWREKYKIHSGAQVEKIVSLRAGDGANIELFEYKSPKGNKEVPYGDDLGWNHTAFYTDDINNSVKYLKSKGITVLSDPNVSTAGPTAGESWVYFLAPWGAQFELVSYPNGKAYEKENPQTKLWSPKLAGESFAITSATKVMATIEVEKLLQLHLATWGEKNVEKRTKNFKLIYTEDVNIVDPFFILNGTANLNPFIDDLQKKHPGFKFSLAKPIETHNNIARLFWQFGPESKPDTITGQDVFAIENNKIKSLYIFIDGLKK